MKKLCFATCIILIAVAVAALAQDATPVFSATSEMVLLDVQVVNRKTNAAFGQLQAKDFDLSEDSVPQKISYFGRDRMPLSIVLIFDLTASVRGVLKRLAESAETALNHLKPEDEVAVMTYAAAANVVDGFTRDRAATVAAIKRAAGMKSGDAAFFNEAMYQAAAELQHSSSPSNRRVVIWLTDNIPNVPYPENVEQNAEGLNGAQPHAEEEAIRKLHESGAVVMPLLLKDHGVGAILFQLVTAGEKRYRKEYPPGDANNYAELTGGFAEGLRGKNVEQRLADYIDSLRGRYTIGYSPSESKPAGTFCHVKVTLAPNAPLHAGEWNVLVRTGYYRK